MTEIALDSQKDYIATDDSDVVMVDIEKLMMHLVFLDGILFIAPSNTDEYAKMSRVIAKYELVRPLLSCNFRLTKETATA